MGYQGNYPPSTPLTSSQIGTGAVTSDAIADGAVVPADLSTGAPSWDTSGNATVSGNLTFSGTAKRITGDFSNATVANRVAFQTSTVNGATQIIAIPNGSGTVSNLGFFNNSDPTNAAGFFVGTASSGTEARLNSTITGTGTYIPITFYTGASERMRIDSSGNVGIGTSSPSTALHVVGEITATQGVTGYATFSAAATGTQTVTSGVYTKATLTTVIFNVGGNYASSRFTPTVAGYYQINGICGATAGTAITYAGAAIYKNGSAESVVLSPGYSGTSALASISDIIYCNGTTDYIELYVRVSGTGTLTVNTNTAFSGCLVRGA